MYPLLYGLFFGLVLAILVGPILFSLIQAGLEHGFKAGLMIGLGVWISDVLFILCVYFGVSYVIAITEWDGFEEYLGVGGGIVLIIIGVGTVLTKPPPFKMKKAIEPELLDPQHLSGVGKLVIEKPSKSNVVSFFTLWLKGFLINTINPFTVFFWIATMTTVVVKNAYTPLDSGLFFGGILLVIVSSDLLKLYLARIIRDKLQYKHVLKARQISGIALVIFGIVLMVRVFVH